MDFRFREEQELVRGLARQILETEVTRERLKAAEDEGGGFDPALWSRLAEANLLGVAVPEAHGGMGFGLLELCVLLEELGRVVAPVPAVATLVLGALPITEWGTDAQRARWLPALAAGKAILSAALGDVGGDAPERPATRADRRGPAWVLSGEKRGVPHAHRTQRILVPARTEAGVALFLLDPQAPGVSLGRSVTSTGEPLCDLTLQETPVEEDALLGGDARGGALALGRLQDLARVAHAAVQLGVAARALEITADHVRERVQFGVPIGSFQAVQHRAADCWTDLSAMRWTTWRAAWLLSEGRPATRAASVAAFWAAEGGARIAAAAQHLHGGLGVDLDYPIHRYFLQSKALELELGGATRELARLGRDMARCGPPQAS